MGTEPTKRKPSASGEATRRRIIDATLATLRDEGIAGTSARSIARAGDLNQALIFYHFDSVDGAIVAAVAEMTRVRIERHAPRFASATTLAELVDIAIELHADDASLGNMTVLIQAFAGANGKPDMGPRLYAELEPWSDLVTTTIERIMGDSAVSTVVPHHVIARTISALFLGIELLDDLSPEQAQGAAMLQTLRELASLLETFMESPLIRALDSMAANPSDLPGE